MPLIYILDDDDDTLFAMEFWLKRNGYTVKSFMNAVQMMHGLKESVPDAVLLDIHLNGEDGREICKYLKKKEQLTKPVFLISTTPESCKDFTTYDADGFMEKPYHMKDLPEMIKDRIDL